MADLLATGLIQPGSRVVERLHVAGEAGAVAAFDARAHSLKRGESLRTWTTRAPKCAAFSTVPSASCASPC